jgi:hypothetical protein
MSKCVLPTLIVVFPELHPLLTLLLVVPSILSVELGGDGGIVRLSLFVLQARADVALCKRLICSQLELFSCPTCHDSIKQLPRERRLFDCDARLSVRVLQQIGARQRT